ncbi:MarR family transcriptional regulator [Rhodococcus sp. BP-241]|uniref:MarR family winged helix-turn-helix transcriptional regulator n=1 Tax=Rhodococcus sp. BP-241 TaxID=2739441 RepID=UPI0027DF059D|nr:MarR family transcriptional regulator [Rhodococcus sp. BP-241]
MDEVDATPPVDTDVMDLVHGLRALVVELDLLGAGFAEKHRMHSTDVRALIVLLDAARAGRTATPSWLRTQLGITSATTTALVDRLELAGHVERQSVVGDRRKVALRVTDKAQRLGTEFFGPLILRAATQLSELSDDDRATIRRYQSAMLAAIRSTAPGS